MSEHNDDPQKADLSPLATALASTLAALGGAGVCFILFDLASSGPFKEFQRPAWAFMFQAATIVHLAIALAYAVVTWRTWRKARGAPGRA